MKRKHDKISKEDRPMEGLLYEIRLAGKPVFEAEVTNYKGGCWANLRVSRALDEEYADLYKPGDEFQTRVAAYEFYLVTSGIPQ